jgi:hypothetical protein
MFDLLTALDLWAGIYSMPKGEYETNENNETNEKA